MSRYPAFVDGEIGAYGVAFPDLPGIVTMGETVDDALLNAEEALRDYVTETERNGERVAEPSPIERVSPPDGATLVDIPPIRISGRTVRATLHWTGRSGIHGRRSPPTPHDAKAFVDCALALTRTNATAFERPPPWPQPSRGSALRRPRAPWCAGSWCAAG